MFDWVLYRIAHFTFILLGDFLPHLFVMKTTFKKMYYWLIVILWSIFLSVPLMEISAHSGLNLTPPCTRKFIRQTENTGCIRILLILWHIPPTKPTCFQLGQLKFFKILFTQLEKSETFGSFLVRNLKFKPDTNQLCLVSCLVLIYLKCRFNWILSF